MDTFIVSHEIMTSLKMSVTLHARSNLVIRGPLVFTRDMIIEFIRIQAFFQALWTFVRHWVGDDTMSKNSPGAFEIAKTVVALESLF